jgi:hypothetical protein
MRQNRGFALAAFATAAVAGGVYAAHVARTRRRFGQVQPAADGEHDDLLDRFMPVYDIVERHAIRVLAPADVTFDVARHVELTSHPVVRAIFLGRELLLGSPSVKREGPKGLLEDMQTLGWGILAEEPNREVVLGAATRPWEATVTFRGVPADQFARFAEPDYVKIAWTLRADPLGPTESVFRTETRAIATDPSARDKFRRYWSLLSPGIVLIRRLTLGMVRSAAEGRRY